MDAAQARKGIRRVGEHVVAADGGKRIWLREEVPGSIAAEAIHLRRADLDLDGGSGRS